MKLSLLIGALLLILGLGLAVMGVASVGGETRTIVDSASGQTPPAGGAWYVVVPVASGLLLAAGGLLIGLGMGNWRHPRSHSEPGDKVVDPEGHHKMKHV